MPSDRRARVAEAMRDELSVLIAREVKDPRVTGGLVSIGEIELNRDLSVAHVSISVLTGDAEAAVAGLQRAAGFLRGPLARRLKLRVAPDLRFHLDRGHAMARKLGDIVREDQDKRREADPDPDPDPDSDSDSDPGAGADSEAEATSSLSPLAGGGPGWGADSETDDDEDDQ